MFRPIFAFCALCATCSPVAAQTGPLCRPHGEVAAMLAENYGETRQSVALTGRGAMIEVWANTETQTWTITTTAPGGLTCLAIAGHWYQATSGVLPNFDPDA